MILVFFLMCIFIGIIGGLLYIVYLPFKKRLIKSGKLSLIRSRQINKVYFSVLLAFSVVQTYFSFFPTDGFYLDEFTSVTFREPPASAEIIKKLSTYPDWHGDYCSCSLIRLSPQDYISLYKELSIDDRLTNKGKLMRSNEFTKVTQGIDEEQIELSFQRKNRKPGDNYFSISFINDKKTIVVHKCVI